MRMPYFRILLAAWLLTGCQQGSTAPSDIANADSLPAENVLFGVHHVTTKDGVRSSELEGDTAYQYDGTNTLFLTGVRLKFYTESGDANGPRRIETEELSYQVKTDELWTENPFVMTQGERVTRGTRFRTDGKFTNWDVSNAETTGGLPTEDSGFSF